MARVFKLALSAGHWRGTSKGCPEYLDKEKTPEWALNARICEKLQALLSEYEGVEILRLDDITGEKNILLDERTDAANRWGADLYLSVHHNGGVNGGKGGGIVAYAHPNASAASFEWQRALYDASVAATGLVGNRATPLAKKNLHELRKSKMPAVLMECGFMDSATDCPIILTDDFADKMASAFCDVIVAKSGARKKERAVTLYRVQVGAFEKLENAKALLSELKNAGFAGYIKADTE